MSEGKLWSLLLSIQTCPGGGTGIWKWRTSAYWRTKVGGIRCRIWRNKTGHSMLVQKNGVFFWCGIPKIRVIQCAKNAIFKPKFANFMLKLLQNVQISQNAREGRENLQFWHESGKKGGALVWTKEQRVIGCKINVKKGVYWQALDIHRHMGVPP